MRLLDTLGYLIGFPDGRAGRGNCGASESRTQARETERMDDRNRAGWAGQRGSGAGYLHRQGW